MKFIMEINDDDILNLYGDRIEALCIDLKEVIIEQLEVGVEDVQQVTDLKTH